MTTQHRSQPSTDSQPTRSTTDTGDPPLDGRRVAPNGNDPADPADVARSAAGADGSEQSGRRAGGRPVFSTVLAVVAAFSIVFSLTGIWVRVTALDSDRFAAAAAPLTKNDDVARAISEYAATEIVIHTGAQDEIQRVLPTDAQVLAAPIASALQDGLAVGVQDVIQTDEFEAVFESVVKVAHEEALLILEGDGDVIESKNGLVTLNLIAVINDVIRATGDDLSALFGTNISLPEINPDDIPADQIAELEAALGVQLPEDFGQVTLFRSEELAEAQTWVNRFDTWLEVMILIAVASTIGAFVLAPDRRRTVITIGCGIPFIAVITWLLVDANEGSYATHIDDPVGRAAARAAAHTMFSGLDRLAWWTIGLSIAAVIAAVATRNVSADQVRATVRAGSGDAPSGRDRDGKEADHG